VDALAVLVSRGRRYGPGDGLPNKDQTGLYNIKLEGPFPCEGKGVLNLRAESVDLGKREYRQ
jgi:hypothetical protein